MLASQTTKGRFSPPAPPSWLWVLLAAVSLLLSPPIVAAVHAIEITVDYRYDSNSFFNPTTTNGMLAREALEAAAKRFSNIIDSPLLGIATKDDEEDVRIGFTHPGTGESYEISSARLSASDSIRAANGRAAQEYRGGITIAEDEWLLFAGARPLDSAANGGTGSGTNFDNVFLDSDSILNRQFRTTGSVSNLPVWGGSIAFDNSAERSWHFDLNTRAGNGQSDFYSIALHEIGHALGLATNWSEWTDNYAADGSFAGPTAVAKYNDENLVSVNSLTLASSEDPHWKDGRYDSLIFAAGSPNLIGTVGLNAPQDLIMEPVANFTNSVRRFELTNVDVAALEDIGWHITYEYPLACDLDSDLDCDLADLDQLVASISSGAATLADRNRWLSDAAARAGYTRPFLLGDANLDGRVNVDDLNSVGLNWTKASGLWSKGDFDGSGHTDAGDLNVLGINWQKSLPRLAAAATVPEPASIRLFVWILGLIGAVRRQQQVYAHRW